MSILRKGRVAVSNLGVEGHFYAKLRTSYRRKRQLTKLMYYQSKNDKNVNKSERQTRVAEKIVFNIPNRCTTKFLNSVYYAGTKLWNELSLDVQRLKIL